MKTKDIYKRHRTKLESQALGKIQIVSRKTIKGTSVKTDELSRRKYRKHQDKKQEQSKRTGQDTSFGNRTSSKKGQDTSFASRPKEQGRTRHQGIRTRHQGIRTRARSKASRTRHKLQDRTSSKTGQDITRFKTRPKQERCMECPAADPVHSHPSAEPTHQFMARTLIMPSELSSTLSISFPRAQVSYFSYSL